jgi:hypothetical protein
LVALNQSIESVLSGLPLLEDLSLRSSQATQEVVAVIARTSPRLRRLSLAPCYSFLDSNKGGRWKRLRKKVWKLLLSNCPHLEEVDLVMHVLFSLPDTLQVLRMLIMHPSMKRLVLTGTFLEQERGDLAELRQLALLHHVVVEYNP